MLEASILICFLLSSHVVLSIDNNIELYHFGNFSNLRQEQQFYLKAQFRVKSFYLPSKAFSVSFIKLGNECILSWIKWAEKC